MKKDRPDELKPNKQKSLKQQTKINIEFTGDHFDESVGPRRRKMESTERQLFNLFEERGNLFI